MVSHTNATPTSTTVSELGPQRNQRESLGSRLGWSVPSGMYGICNY